MSAPPDTSLAAMETNIRQEALFAQRSAGAADSPAEPDQIHVQVVSIALGHDLLEIGLHLLTARGDAVESDSPGDPEHVCIDWEGGLAARETYRAFMVKWTKLCPGVARSLADAGEQLLTFYAFPRAMWRALRTTNSLENLNREFRRRTKTQASFSTEAAAVTLLYGLVAFGQIQMRKIDGHRHVWEVLSPDLASAA